MDKINSLKEQIQKLKNQRNAIDVKISIMQKKYNEHINIHRGDMYIDYANSAYIKVLSIDKDIMHVLHMDRRSIRYDWLSKECITRLKQLTALPEDMNDMWKSRGINITDIK